jgi:hypothetical protein
MQFGIMARRHADGVAGTVLRKVQKRTTLRAEWTASDNTTGRFFDYVLKKTTRCLS